MTPLAAVPNEPIVGRAKAVGSNQRLAVRWAPGRLGSRNWSGRIVTWAGVPLVVNTVPVGSGPVHIGVRNCPE
jgi:hypothetical protein